MNEYSVERILSYLADDAWAVEDGKGNQIMRFAWDKRQEAEALAEALNAAWRAGHENGVASVGHPRLAPEHVKALRGILFFYDRYDNKYGLVGGDAAAIRAALAALGEG